jgi:ATP synthase protein I
MAPEKKNDHSFSNKIGEKERRKLKEKPEGDQSVWVGLSMFGMVGWSVVAPTLLGAAAGIWLDKAHPTSFSWTLVLLLSGLFIGCLMAWYWVAREHKEDQVNHNGNEE